MVTGDRRKIFAGRYAYLKPLGRGAGGAVYLCEDIQAGGREVAVKVLTAEAFATVQGKMIKREFEILSKLDHPNLVRVYDYGALPDGGVFLAEEYIDGFSLQDARALIPPHGLIDICLQLLHALSYLHGMGMIHRDIKPANVMLLWLDDANAQPMVKLVDFGLSSADPTRDTLRGGTRSYMAPEIIRGDKGEFRSDLYSLGVTLYYAMCGVLPFGPRTKDDPPTSEEDFRPPEPHRLNPEVPLNLSRFTMILLRQLGSFEYADAGEALQALASDSDSLEWIATGQLANSLDIAAPPVLRGYFERGIVEHEIDLQEALVDRITAGSKGQLRLVQGGRGVGKSRLFREIGSALKIAGILVLNLSCTPGMLPHGLILSMISALVELVDSRGLTVGERLRPNIMLLQRLSTWLGSTGTSEDSNLDWIREAMDDLEFLLQPDRLVILIEDIHHADRESLEFLRVMYTSGGPTPTVVANLVPDGFADGLMTCPNIQITTVTGLRHSDVKFFFETRLGVGHLPEDWLFQVASFARGNPSYVEELSRHLIDSGLLTRRSSIQWSLNVQELLAFALPRTKSESLRRRLSTFGHNGREVLEILALSEGPVEWSVVRKLILQSSQKGQVAAEPREVDRIIEMLRWRQFIAIDLNTEGRLLRLIDEELRDVIVAPMSPEWKRSLHRRLAERAQRDFLRGKGDARTVARQMDRGGHERAQMWLELAGHVATLSDLKEALVLYRRSLEIANGPALVEINLRLAEVSQRVTDTRRAVEHLEAAWATAERTGHEMVMYQVCLAGLRLTLALGQVSHATEWISKIDDLMPSLSRQPWTLYWRARLAIAEGHLSKAIALLSEARQRFDHFGSLAGSVHVQALQFRVALWGDGAPDLFDMEAEVEEGRNSGVDAAFAFSLLGFGRALRQAGQLERAHRLLTECFDISTQVGGPDLCAEALMELAVTDWSLGDRRRGLERMREANWLARATEHPYWSALTRIAWCEMSFAMGEACDFEEVVSLAQSLVESPFPFWYEGLARSVKLLSEWGDARAIELATTYETMWTAKITSSGLQKSHDI